MLTQIHLRRSYSLLRLEIKRTYPNIRHTVTLIQYLILNIPITIVYGTWQSFRFNDTSTIFEISITLKRFVPSVYMPTLIFSDLCKKI